MVKLCPTLGCDELAEWLIKEPVRRYACTKCKKKLKKKHGKIKAVSIFKFGKA